MRNAPTPSGVYVEQGVASWYGIPFHGHRAADGEIFDMNTMVAAHRTLPFGSMVRVTNLSNGLSADVRIIDRGPFVGDRILDLAFAAAQSIDMVRPGTAMVRIELLSGPSPAGGEFTVQIGAFTDSANAQRLRDRLLGELSAHFHSGDGYVHRPFLPRSRGPRADSRSGAEAGVAAARERRFSHLCPTIG